MNPMGGLPFIAEGALTKGMAVMVGTAYPQVKVTSGANVLVIGFAINDAASGQEVAIFPVNGAGKCKAIAGASVTRGVFVMAEGNDGRVKDYAADNTNQYACGIALEAGEDGQLIDILPVAFMAETALT